MLTKPTIIQQLQAATTDFVSFGHDIDPHYFFLQPPAKWSIAQNVQHLIISANATGLAYALPKLILRLYTGKPNRASRSYDELVTKYKTKLQQGGKASGQFVPAAISPGKGKEKMLHTYTRSMERLTAHIDKKWNDENLDRYLAPHPLLGKITLRELAYFTIYHTGHHLAIIKRELGGMR